MDSENNSTLNKLATELQNMLLKEDSESDDQFQALLEKILRIGNGVKLQIRPNDHNPPHFHVRVGNDDACFYIHTGQLMKGSLGHKANRVVQQFYKSNQTELMSIWNSTRPGVILEGVSYMVN